MADARIDPPPSDGYYEGPDDNLTAWQAVWQAIGFFEAYVSEQPDQPFVRPLVAGLRRAAEILNRHE